MIAIPWSPVPCRLRNRCTTRSGRLPVVPRLSNAVLRVPGSVLGLGMLTLLALAIPRSAVALDLDTEVAIVAFEDARDASPQLLAFLQDEDPTIRSRAALAVGRIGRADDVARLAALLQDDDVDVRRNAAFALGEVEDSTAAFPLEELLLSGFETDPEVRELAVDGLGKLGRGAEACRAALRDGAERVQARALLAAWRIPGATEVEEILQFSRHKKMEVRWCGAYCLMRMLGAPASGRTPIPGGSDLSAEDRDRIAARLLVLTGEEDPRVVLQAVRGLRTRPEEEVTRRMVALLSHPDWRVRVEALRTLAATLPAPEGDEGGEGDEGDEGDESDAGHEGDESDEGDEGNEDTTGPAPDHREVAMESLEPLLHDANPNVVATLLEALARIGGDGAREALDSALSSPVPRHRELALRSLAARERESATDELPVGSDRLLGQVAQLAKDPIWFVRAACIDVADLLQETERRELLLGLAREEPRIAKLAVGPYLELRDAETEGWPRPADFQPELDEFLGSDDPMVVLMTLDALDSAYGRAEEARAEAPEEIAEDWTDFATLLEEQRARALDDPLWTDVRQSIVAIAGPRADVPGMEALLVRSAVDPNFLVRRDAIAALEDAGKPAPRAPGPVETRHTEEQVREILEWAKDDHRAVFETANGTFEARLFTRDAPLTCWNFARLAESGFYDDGAWHRVVPNFVLQDGCPRGDGWGGPPWQIRCELNRNRYGRGALGMALSGKDTGGSQFFFTHASQPHLDGGYTVFGELVQGRPAAERVSQGDPITRIRVVRD